jgi:hypothetical protein
MKNGRLRRRMKYRRNGCSVFPLLIVIFFIIGEANCLIKAIDSDWNPIGKREVVYGGAFITGLGGFVGCLDIIDLIDDIEDEPRK